MITKERLEYFYNLMQLSQYKIASIYHTSAQNICRHMKKFNIIARPDIPVNKIKIDEKIATSIRLLYKSGLNRMEVANKLKITEQYVRNVLKGNFRTKKDNNLLTIEKKSHELDDRKLQCILGTLLGDGSLSYYRNSYMLAITHGKKQKEYLEYKRKIIGAPTLIKLHVGCNSYAPNTIKFRICYQNKGCLQKISDIVTIDHKKTINEKWLSLIDVEGLAYWFMDDGSSSWMSNKKYVYVRFATNGFNLDEINLIINKLRGLDLTPKILIGNNGGSNLNISLNKSSLKFIKMIEPYILPIKCMRYKIKYPIDSTIS